MFQPWLSTRHAVLYSSATGTDIPCCFSRMESARLNDIADELAHRYPKGSITIGVGVDGSQMSDKAVEMACQLWNCRRKDKLVLLHVADPSKDYLPKHLHPSHLQNYYTDLAGKYHATSEWLCKNKQPGQSTCEVLTHLSDSNQANILVVGSFGRKGEKLDMLGSVSDFSLRETHSSICIVRSTGTSPCTRGMRYLLATDGSRAAAFAFCSLIKLILNPKDTLDVCMICYSAAPADDQTLVAYKQFMAENKVQGTCFVRTIDGQRTVVDGILDACKNRENDLLALGITGYSKKKLGSVSEELTMRARCTTLIIKDRKQIEDIAHAGAKSLTHAVRPTGLSFQALVAS